MKQTEILERTFTQMPNVFTTNDFKIKAIENGYFVCNTIGQRWFPFLRKYADNNKVKGKTWTKRDNYKNQSVKSTQESIMPQGEDLSKAIQMVKAAGYKVMKPVNDWIEL